MFQMSHVPVRIANVTHQQMQKDDDEIALTVLACEISPFPAGLAGELHDFVRGTLYTRTGAEVNSLLAGCSFALDLRPQEVEMRLAPDQSKPTLVLPEAKIANFRASRPKRTSSWTLHFSITCSPASAKQLHDLVDCHTRTRYMCFADSEGTLFDEPTEEQKTRRARRQSEAEETAAPAAPAAPATH
jgi:hypothetical protein